VPREWRDSDTGSQGSAQLLDARTISKMNSPQLRDLMGSRTMLEVISLRDWLVGDARRLDEPSKNLEELCSRLLAMGVPLDRVVISISTLRRSCPVNG
jgi:adenylate cyclase